MRKSCYILVFLIFGAIAFNANAQEVFNLKIITAEESETKGQPPVIEYQSTFPDSLSRHREIQKYLTSLYGMGFLAATFDSLRITANLLTSFLNPGSIYKWAELKAVDVDEGILSKIGFRDKLYNNKPVNYKEVRKLQERLLGYCENNGYPFAVVRLDSVMIGSDSIHARLNLIKNTEYFVDSIIIKGDAGIAPVYLYSYLGIKPGDLYNEELIRQISARIKELPFIKETKPAQVEFSDKSAKAVVYLSGKKANRFNGIIGFMPNSETTGKLLVTGEAQLKLLNSFEHGELMDINWRSLQPRTQDLKVNGTYPFILSSPFGADVNFNLYRKDTLYIDLHSSLGLQYLLRGGNYMKVFVKNKSTRLLGDYNANVSYADIKSALYGLGYKSQKTDYLLNPRKGYFLQVEGGAGNKKIKNNPYINPDSVVFRSVEFEGSGALDVFVPLAARHVAKLALKGGLRSSKTMFENELFRLGGLSTLRGFDEESILASTYTIYTLEYRYLLEQNSYLFLFFDGSYYENEVKRLRGDPWIDQPFGYGAGISFETRAGIFTLSYALGQQKGNPPDIKAAKVHFGIVNRF